MDTRPPSDRFAVARAQLRPPKAALSVRAVYWCAILLVIVLTMALAWFVIDPAPPASIRLATGLEGSFYERLGNRLKAALSREGVEVVLVPTEGSRDNIELLLADKGGVDAAFVQGGVGPAPEEDTPLRALASLAIEPLWLFARNAVSLDVLNEDAPLRLAAGTPGSGTLDAVQRLVAVTGISPTVELVELNGHEAADALMAGTVDAAAFVTPAQAPWIFELLRRDDLFLVEFDHARALALQLPFAQEVTLLARVLDYKNRIPRENVTLIAAATSMLVREDLHPAVKQLLLQVSSEIASPEPVFEIGTTFPSPRLVEYPLDAEARRFFDHGPTLFRRWLPYWGANLVERFWVLIIPIVTLLLPIMRYGPSTIDWSIRRRVWRWYKELRELELAAAEAEDDEERRRIGRELREVETKVRDIGVPLAFRDDLYRLRTHIAFVRTQLGID